MASLIPSTWLITSMWATIEELLFNFKGNDIYDINWKEYNYLLGFRYVTLFKCELNGEHNFELYNSKHLSKL